MLFFPRPKSSTINKIIEDQSHKMNFVFPLALINEKEEKLKNLITINNGKNKRNKIIRKRKDNENRYK